ncbi:MAG: adenylate/guanylate cyclase domain-containing protein [Deltaproteobacteria bacterium]|nr:adenylate/guanylate cyclase domain-containing protein [Deltaproteobacteria bacterium]
MNEDLTANLLKEELSRTQLRNERLVARMMVVAALLIGLSGVWAGLTIDHSLLVRLLVIALTVSAWYAFAAPRLLSRSTLPVMQFIHVTLEVVATNAPVMVDIFTVGPVYALTSTPPLLTFVSVMLAGMRFNRRLSWYAGILGATVWLTLYALARAHLTGAEIEAMPTLSWNFAILHASYLVLAGWLSALIAKAGYRLAQESVSHVQDKARVLQTFGEYVAPQAVESILAGTLSEMGERREVTVLFADIRNFTSQSSQVEPERVVAWLNEVFGPLTDIVADHGGMVNKFLGDGLLAVFGAPKDDPDHPDHAALAALAMAEAATRILRPDGTPTQIGVGLHVGDVILGSVGTARRRDYTVIGDAVNTASRIESLTKTVGTPVLASEAVIERLSHALTARTAGLHQVKGKAPIEVFSVTHAQGAEPTPSHPQ